MVEPYRRQSPLAHLGLQGRAQAARGEAAVALAERPFQAIVDLRAKRGEAGVRAAFESAFGFALPEEPNTSAGGPEARALWLGPDEWWILAPGPDPRAGPDLAAKLRQALAGQVAAVTDVSESRACIRVSGPRARALVQKGCPLDLHPRAFAPGKCAQSLLAKAGVLVHLVADDPAEGATLDLYVVRSFADYLWRWLEDAAREYGLAILEG